MARPLRIEYPGALYHITTRGNDRQAIYRDDQDRLNFLDLLENTIERYHWVCHAYCLMDNHYHLLIETPDARLSLGMRQLNGVYTQRTNRKHQLSGHLFQGRYQAILVDRDHYLLELCRYVVLNPVRAHLVKRPGDWVWSSYRATAGLSRTPAWLSAGWILACFESNQSTAQRHYRKFVREGIAMQSPWADRSGQVLLGEADFIEQFKDLIQEKANSPEIPRQQRYADRPSLSQLFPEERQWEKPERNERMADAHLKHGYTLTAIARHLGLHYTTVSKVIQKIREEK